MMQRWGIMHFVSVAVTFLMLVSICSVILEIIFGFTPFVRNHTPIFQMFFVLLSSVIVILTTRFDSPWKKHSNASR